MKSDLLGAVAALYGTSAALGGLAGFECAGSSCGDCNEGSDGEKGRETHRWSGRVGESRGDGMLFG